MQSSPQSFLCESPALSRRDLLGLLPLAIPATLLPIPGKAAKSAPFVLGSNMLGVSQVGYRTGAAKRLLQQSPGAGNSATFTLMSGSTAVRTQLAVSATYDFGCAYLIQFGDITTPGAYTWTCPGQPSASFTIGDSVWKNLLPTLVSYQTAQRCGMGVPGVHGPCHLDDAKRRDTLAPIDTTGGWHDAGDLRKWVDSTLMNLFGLLAIVRNLGAAWNSAGVQPLLNEARWGNGFFLKMQDTDGLVWADTGGGVNGDNSDNHWTDNVRGTADDRWVNVQKNSNVQAMFITGEAMAYQAFAASDMAYASTCLNAAVNCWNASTHTSVNTSDLAWWTLAALEMFRATGQSQYSDAAASLASTLSSAQLSAYTAGQQTVCGNFPMWPNNTMPFSDPVHSGLPGYALLQAAELLASNAAAPNWSAAVKLYLDSYVLPLTARSAYGFMPYSIYSGAPTSDLYRPIGGTMSYRFFMPASVPGSFVGLNSHLLSHALLLAEASAFFRQNNYRDLAYAQLEWVFGCNPYGATLATGVGVRNPPAFSPFVGPIKGGIMNGVCGSVNDTMQLAQTDNGCWQTNEYWSPHNGYCQWAISVLEKNA